MANINRNYDNKTKLPQWWPIVKSNFDLLNTDLVGLEDRVDNLVNEPDPNKDLELVDARLSSVYGSFPHLKGRLDAFDESFGIVDVKLVGAIGDGVVDDTHSIELALQRCVDKQLSMVILPPGIYRITNTIVIPPGLTLVGHGATIISGTNNFKMLQASSNTKFVGLKIVGGGDGVIHNEGIGIYIKGQDGNNRIQNVEIYNCDISELGVYGVYSEFAHEVRVERSFIHDVGYCGCMFITCNGTIVNECLFQDITTGIVGDAYGVSITSKIGQPKSTDGIISNNWVKNIPSWKGLDTHGGVNIKFLNNTVSGCKHGIGVVESDGESEGPENCQVMGNTILGVGTGYGIALSKSKNSQASGNILVHCGADVVSSDGAIYCVDNDNVGIYNNTLKECYSLGVNIYYGNQGFNVSGNIIEDIQSAISANASGISIRSENNKGVIVGNNILRNNPSLNTFVSRNGVWISTPTGNDIYIGVNYNKALIPYSGGEGQVRKFASFGSDVFTFVGFGSPEGVITASVGSQYIDLNGSTGTTFYFKENGSSNTGWVAK